MIVPAMSISANGRKLIEQFEGLYTRAYQDVAGIWTIGYGHTTTAGLPRVAPGMVITPTQADQILSSDLAAVEVDINHHVSVPLNQNQFDALGSFDFNTGELDHSSLLSYINRGGTLPEIITNFFLMWDHAHVNGVLAVVKGLQNRRIAEAKLFNTPIGA